MTTTNCYDLTIVGAGFSGSLLAMIARHLGLRVILLEKGTHPRFAIGESATPLAGITLERLSRRYDLPRLLPLTAWGLWQKELPDVGRGLKRGFTFFHHVFGKAFAAREDRSDHLLVAASPHDNIADTHWFRSDVDAWLAGEAKTLGAEYWDRTDLETYRREGDYGIVTGVREGRPFSLQTRFLIDCSGEGGFLIKQLDLKRAPLPGMERTCTLFNHFRGVKTWAEAANPFPQGGPPYSIDAAAVHHVFEGGWIWVLRFNNGITSAGVVAREKLAQELGLAEKETAWNRLLERLPSMRAMFRDAESMMPWRYADPLPRLCETLVGDGWALVPHTAGFVDPMFSSGIALTLFGVERLAGILERLAEKKDFSAALKDYESREKADIETMARFIGACYKTFDAFPLFVAISHLYFVAVSYSETALRLGLPERAGGFLLNQVPEFRNLFDRFVNHPILDADHQSFSGDEIAAFANGIARSLKPWNIAGLCDPAKRNWYGFDLDSLLDYADAFGVSRQNMKNLVAEQRERIRRYSA